MNQVQSLQLNCCFEEKVASRTRKQEESKKTLEFVQVLHIKRVRCIGVSGV